MPRKDRSFTASDIARLYCNRLDESQKQAAIFKIAACPSEEWGTDFVVSVFSFLLDVLGEVDIPFGNLLSAVIEILIDALKDPTTEARVIDALRSIEPMP